MPGDESLGSLPEGGGMDRRTVLVTLAGLLATAGCSREASQGPPGSASTARRSTPEPTSVAAAPSTPAPSSFATAPSTAGSSRPPAAQTRDPIPQPAIARAGGPDIIHGPRSRPEVALTFHGAGASSLTEQILGDCADHGARITVFAVGQWIAAAPALGPQILAGGHELGNHTWSHQEMPALSARAAGDEIRRCADALRSATGSNGWWFRPSGTPRSTATIRAAASRSGYQRCVAYDVDPLDYRDPGPVEVASRTLAQVRPGSIVSLHLGHVGTVAALPQILAGLAARKLVPVTLSWLLRD